MEYIELTKFNYKYMRILQLHVDYIEFTPIQKEINDAETITQSQIRKMNRIEETVVILTSVEKGDDETVIDEMTEEIKNYLEKIKCKSIVLYPYAHLSSNLESPQNALKIIKKINEKLIQGISHITIHSAPFGWTKELKLKIKGHPLAENSKVFSKNKSLSTSSSSTILPSSKTIQSIKDQKNLNENVTLQEPKDEENSIVSKAVSSESILKSFWYILDPNGQLIPIESYKFKKDQKNLEILLNYETAKKRTVDEQPPHVKLMRKLGIADYEPASDSGNMRFYPKGRLMKSLLEQFVSRKVHEYGGIEVETPIMYDSHHPSMESYFNRFPARQYNIYSDQKELFLRFAACFGQFLMTKDFQISYKNLPLRLYELTRYSFRREKSGELVGLRRLRAFSMPDCHAFCKDLDQSKEEAIKRLNLSISVVEEIGLSITEDLEMAIRFTDDFYENNKGFIQKIAQTINKPILVEMWKERFFYFILKWEFNFIDNLNKASSLSTDQIDIENGERYGITYTDENGNKKTPIILHNSPSGAIERIIFALLEKAAKMMKKGNTPILPLWLMNTQIRIIPVNNNFLNHSMEINNILKTSNIRSDVDDRDETLSKKIRDAETEWIHYIVIIGEKEIVNNVLSVRSRIEKKNIQMRIEELIKIIKDETSFKPFLPINLPELISQRPKISE